MSLSALKPLDIITFMDADTWEDFIVEALSAATPKYLHVERRGGSGDKGRDVIACTADSPHNGPFDLFQCKAYQAPLTASDIWTELGKLCVFTHNDEYPVPRRYRFASPRGVTTPLGNLLDKPNELRTGLMHHWHKHCERHISSTTHFPLAGTLKTYVENFDFSIVHHIPLNDILALHRQSSYWHVRFKRDYPTRPAPDAPPADPLPNEMRYVRQLLDAYGQHMNTHMPDISALATHDTLSQHFNGCRTDFFMADSLNRFYRDARFPGAFEHIKSQIAQGIRNTVLRPHQDGYYRVCAVLEQAAALLLAKTDYDYCVEPGDKQGLCHHLANDDAFKWVQ